MYSSNWPRTGSLRSPGLLLASPAVPVTATDRPVPFVTRWRDMYPATPYHTHLSTCSRSNTLQMYRQWSCSRSRLFLAWTLWLENKPIGATEMRHRQRTYRCLRIVCLVRQVLCRLARMGSSNTHMLLTSLLCFLAWLHSKKQMQKQGIGIDRAKCSVQNI